MTAHWFHYRLPWVEEVGCLSIAKEGSVLFGPVPPAWGLAPDKGWEISLKEGWTCCHEGLLRCYKIVPYKYVIKLWSLLTAGRVGRNASGSAFLAFLGPEWDYITITVKSNVDIRGTVEMKYLHVHCEVSTWRTAFSFSPAANVEDVITITCIHNFHGSFTLKVVEEDNTARQTAVPLKQYS